MALLSPIPRYAETAGSIREQRKAAMLDNPEKTTKLLTAMKAALPFEVELTPDVIAYLRAQRIANNVKPMQMVAKVSYAGDEGGVICHLAPEDGHDAIILSLTHVRIYRPQLLAAAVFDYQTHRVKKLKKQRPSY